MYSSLIDPNLLIAKDSQALLVNGYRKPNLKTSNDPIRRINNTKPTLFIFSAPAPCSPKFFDNDLMGFSKDQLLSQLQVFHLHFQFLVALLQTNEIKFIDSNGMDKSSSFLCLIRFRFDSSRFGKQVSNHLLEIFQELEIDYSKYEHPPVLTVEEQVTMI